MKILHMLCLRCGDLVKLARDKDGAWRTCTKAHEKSCPGEPDSDVARARLRRSQRRIAAEIGGKAGA